ncbi:MAG: M23 family metallopeptidase [Actinomycetota bacterium]
MASKAPAIPIEPPPVCPPAPKPPRLKRTPPRNTSRLVSMMTPLLEKGLSAHQAMVLAAPPFPVAGPARFSDDWLNARTTPCPHLHKGTDIFADFGTPIVASGPGTIVAMGRHAVAGLAIWIQADTGDAMFYAHLQRFAPGVDSGMKVQAGTIIGEVGDTGNAEGGTPHLHFQYHPVARNRKGKVLASGVERQGNLGHSRPPPVNPKPFLDELLARAEANAPALVAQLTQNTLVLPELQKAPIVLGQKQLVPRSQMEAEGILQLSGTTKSAAFAARALGLVALLTVLGAFVVTFMMVRSRKPKSTGTDPPSYKPLTPGRQLI